MAFQPIRIDNFIQYSCLARNYLEEKRIYVLFILKLAFLSSVSRKLLDNYRQDHCLIISVKLQHLTMYNNLTSTIVAKNYGTAAVISYNVKGIAPPVPPVQCWADKNLRSGCEAPTLKRVGWGGGGGEGGWKKSIRKWYITTECM